MPVFSKEVKLHQEWLCLHGFNLRIDGIMGPATQATIRSFQAANLMPVTGIVDLQTFNLLSAPISAANKPINPGISSLGNIIVAYARQHLAQHPREVGGQNRGPWVRYYMDGNEGDGWPWCAGFVSKVLKTACATMGSELPLPLSFSCDVLAMNAKSRGIFFSAPIPSERIRVKPGSFFLVRRTTTDWIHTGIVTEIMPEFMRTIEGNTNDEGSREGFEVCARTRGYGNMDFILMP